jgi:signal transduction histidine kinase/CheY-like chemotaxis protein
MPSSAEQLIDVYRNAPSVENLCKQIAHDLSCDFIMVSWSMGKQYWYIAGILDCNIDGQVQPEGYMDVEPDANNIPVKHSKLTETLVIKSKLAKILCGKGISSPRGPPGSADFVLSPTYKFAVEAFMDKLAIDDLLARQKSRQESMLSNISHSIRTPLNGILHMCNSIMAVSKSNPDLKISEQLEYLNQSAVALATNIFDIVDLTKLELGKLTLNKEVFDVREMVNSIMSLANTLNKSKNITLEYHVAQSVPTYIFSDKKRIKQILINLLENSLQHTQQGEVSLYVDSMTVNLAEEDSDRTVSISENKHGLYATDFQHSISFSVRDTGTGMDRSVSDNLFKPIDILDKSTKQTGLSLRISSMLADTLGGRLSLVYSEQGKGSYFDFNLVVCEEEMPIAQSKSLKSLKGKSVLLIDATSDRIEMCRLFEKYGVKYTLASTYDEVLVLHLEKHFDMTIIHDDYDLATFSDIKTHISTGVLLGITNESQKIKAGIFDDIMSVPTDPTEYKSKILELFNAPVGMQSVLDKCKILVVEDEQINRIVIEKILRQLGYKKISLAVNGMYALKQFPNLRPDIMLIDIRMPLMNGFELAEKIHTMCLIEGTTEPKMLGVTAQIVMEEDIKPWFKEFVYKPIDIPELDKKIRSMIGC